MSTVLSIIVPVYNCENYIQHLLYDVQRQTFSQYEVILIDDGSTDRSGEICDQFCQKDARFRVFHMRNQGVSHARNEGIIKATGEYIRFLDSDDQIASDSIEKMMGCIESSNVDLVVGGFWSEREVWKSELTGICNQYDLFLDFSKYAFSFYYGVVWNKLYKKKLIVEHQIRFDEQISMCEDALFNFEYFKHVDRVFYLKDKIYSYFNREDSLVTKVTYKDNAVIEEKCLNVLYDFVHQADIVDEAIKNNMMAYLAYRYHIAYCRICYSGKAGYFKDLRKDYWAYKQYGKHMNVRRFWCEFDNMEQFFVYKMIKFFCNMRCDGLIFVFVRTKEYVRVHSSSTITNIRKIIKNPTMKV